MSTQIALTSLSKRFHFTPLSSLSASPRAPDAPKLIFLFSWMGAKIPHVQKYVSGYNKIWPSTPIILVQSLAQDFRPFSRYASEYGTLMTLVAQYNVDLTTRSSGNDVLMVTMSNGGCWSAQAFLATYPPSSILRPRIMIHDSCPGLPRYSNTLNAFLIAGKYRLFSKVVATVVITIYYLLARTIARTLGQDTVKEMRSMMIERIKPQRRVYIYSKEDALIDYRDVEAHANDARTSENEVKTEMFEGSAHVMHLRSDEHRYWKIIQEAWNPSSQAKTVNAPESAESKTSLDDSYVEASALPSSLDASYASVSVPSSIKEGLSLGKATSLATVDDAQVQANAQPELEPSADSRSEIGSQTSDVSESELDPSILGTKAYWDKFYEREYGNYNETKDEGEIWFGEESEARIIRYLDATYPPSSPRPSSAQSQSQRRQSIAAVPRILDLGTGNGHLLLAIHEAGFKASVMKGIDYSPASVQLATSIASARGLKNISFEVVDFLSTHIIREKFDLVLDKGTFDAISLSSQTTDQGEKLWNLYARSVAGYMTRDSRLIVTSCNWTKEELVTRLTADGLLGVHAYFKEPKKTFTFGGKSGSTTSQVVFKLA